MNEGRRQTARNLLAAATKRPWRWGDWGAQFGNWELDRCRMVLEYNPTHPGVKTCVERRRNDGARMVLRLEEPIESEANALLLVEAPVLLEEALDEMERLERARAGWEADALREAENVKHWRTRAEDAERELSKAAKRIVELEEQLDEHHQWAMERSRRD